MPTLIEGGTVVAFQAKSHALIPDGQVVYEGNQIVFVGHDYAGSVDERIDARGKLVIPGFVNHHMAFGIHMQFTRLDKARPNFFQFESGARRPTGEGIQRNRSRTRRLAGQRTLRHDHGTAHRDDDLCHGPQLWATSLSRARRLGSGAG